MSETVLVGIMSLVGTLVGTLGGILASNKLVTFRIERLEAKVEKHNKVVERTFKLEGQMTEIQHEVQDLKKYHIPN